MFVFDIKRNVSIPAVILTVEYDKKVETIGVFDEPNTVLAFIHKDKLCRFPGIELECDHYLRNLIDISFNTKSEFRHSFCDGINVFIYRAKHISFFHYQRDPIQQLSERIENG